MKEEKEKRVSVQIPVDFLAGLDRVRIQQGGLTRTSVVRLALAEYLAKYTQA